MTAPTTVFRHPLAVCKCGQPAEHTITVYMPVSAWDHERDLSLACSEECADALDVADLMGWPATACPITRADAEAVTGLNLTDPTGAAA